MPTWASVLSKAGIRLFLAGVCDSYNTLNEFTKICISLRSGAGEGATNLKARARLEPLSAGVNIVRLDL